MNIVTHLLSKTIANQCVRIDGAGHGLSVLNEFLTQLQQRLDSTHRDYVLQEALTMREAIGDIIEMAYEDFATFSEHWVCTLHYYEHVERSNIFVINLEEKNGGYRNFNFRFVGLKGATIH